MGRFAIGFRIVNTNGLVENRDGILSSDQREIDRRVVREIGV